MFRTSSFAPIAVVAALVAIPASGSVLTFDQFTDAAKTIRVPVGSTGSPPNQFYGDNITDFSPSGPVGGRYVNNGSAGGYTPNIAVAYRWYDTLDPTNPNPDNNGPGGSFGWTTGYGGLLHVIFSDADTLNRDRWLSEVQFTPDPGYQVTLSSFDFAGYLGAQAGQTLKIVADANSPGAQVLWSAGPDGAVTFPALAETLYPLITGAPGQTLSILWGFSDRSGLDNIQFSQESVPELPYTRLVVFGAILVQVVRTRRGHR
jgi:hypothetical protein